jgi:hypothetical protein
MTLKLRWGWQVNGLFDKIKVAKGGDRVLIQADKSCHWHIRVTIAEDHPAHRSFRIPGSKLNISRAPGNKFH